MSRPVMPNPWTALRRHTPARIALGRCGAGLPTAPLLEFGLAHARARDAVHAALDAAALHRGLRALGLASLDVHSAAGDRASYLRRPDLGRRLDAASAEALHGAGGRGCDLVLVIADGLSATAVGRHALPLLEALLPRLGGLRLGPAVVARQARVALGDAVGERLDARLALVLIGERPGLSATDSLGAYLTWQPRSGRSDAERNCVSNIRPEGLGYAQAARRIAFLADGARRLGATGVALKDESDADEADRRPWRAGMPAPPEAGRP